jgi:hypothetical protein
MRISRFGFRICRFGFIVVVDVEKEMKLKGER